MDFELHYMPTEKGTFMKLLGSKILQSAALILTFLVSPYSQADLTPILPIKHEIPGAISLSISPSGQKFFEKHLGQIITNLGFNLSEGYFSEQTVISPTTINLDELEKKFPEPIKVVKEVRTLLTEWLVGFTLRDHRPAFQIGASEYAAEISRMAVITDQVLMTQLNRRDGAVLVIELEVKKITAQVDVLKVWDAQNLQLGELGLKNVSVTLGNSQQSPLFIRLPVYVALNQQDELRFEVLSFDQNFDRMAVDIKYEGLIIPQLLVEMNGHKYPLNNSRLEKYVQDQIPTLLSKAREYVKDFAKKDLPAKLNQMAETKLKGQIEEVQRLSAAGKPDGDQSSDYLWGLKLKKLKLQNNLYIGFNAYIEDPSSRQNIGLNPSFGSRGAPDLDHEAIPHDLVMSIDRGVLNRVLQLSFMRGYFSDLAQGDTKLKLQGVPSLDYAPTPVGEKVGPLETFIKIHVKTATDPNSMALAKTIVLDFDIIAKLVPSQPSQEMAIVLHSIDLNSVQMDKKYMSFIGSFFPGKVMTGIKDKLKASSATWKTQREVLDGKMDLPPPILGQKLDLQKLSFDPRGHLVMYLNFRPSSDTPRPTSDRKSL